MSKLLQKAIDNNVGLYRTILGHLGIGWRVEADLAYTDEGSSLLLERGHSLRAVAAR